MWDISGGEKGGGLRGGGRGVRKTSDSRASSKRFDSATGSPLTLLVDNMGVCVFNFP